MKDIGDYMNYGFETYSEDGKLLNKIDGPGYTGEWLADCRSTAPELLAIIPAPYNKVVQNISREKLWRTVMIPVDMDCKDTGGERIEAVMLAADSEKEARMLAREFGCDVYYWSWWEETRSIILVDAATGDDYPKGDDWEFYTVNEA